MEEYRASPKQRAEIQNKNFKKEVEKNPDIHHGISYRKAIPKSAYAVDAVERHNRRHPDRKLEGVQNLREFYNDDFDAYSEED